MMKQFFSLLKSAKGIVSLLAVLACVNLYAADKTLTGTVSDAQSGDPLIGATVRVKGNAIGTLTNESGKYSITVPDNTDSLFFSYVGYKTLAVAVANRTVIDVTLSSDNALLDEVVVIGYGQVKKRDVTTAIASVRADELRDQPVTGFDQALVGKLAGVQVLQPSGSPGAALSVRVRGVGSISAGNEPLYVIDGVPISNDNRNATGNFRGDSYADNPVNTLSSLNVNDIESIEVLKDASAAAIYGSRGSNGVVIITTKRGKTGKPAISYDTYLGWQSASKKIDMLTAYEYAELNAEGRNAAYIDRVPTGKPTDPNSVRPIPGGQIPPEIQRYIDGEQGLTDTDWQDEIYRTALIQTHNVSISGSKDNLRFFVSGDYQDQEGLIIGSGFKRYGGRVNLDINSGKLTVGLNFNPTYIEHDLVNSEGPWFDQGVVAGALHIAPIWPVYNPDGSYNFGGNAWGYAMTDILNPVAVALEVDDQMRHSRMLGNVYGEYELFEGLKYRLSLGTDMNHFRRDYYRPSTIETLGRKGPSVPIGRSGTEYSLNWLVENTLSYNKAFGNHTIGAIAGFSSQKEREESNILIATNFPNDLVPTLNAGQVTGGNSFASEWSLLSVLGRVQYDFKSKYLLSAAVRADGSSRFGKGNKWGYFPSVSAGWRLTEESFMNNVSWLSDLKLRASYGFTGNFQIPNYGSVGLLGFDDAVLGNEIINSGLAPSTPSNENLKWERTGSFDIGLDAGFFNNLLSFTFDYYQSNTTDLLLNVPVPRTSGFSTELQNIGEVQNTGFEFTIGTQGNKGKFGWNATANIATNKNEVQKLGPSGEPIIVTGGTGSAYFKTEIGGPIGAYFLMVQDGVFSDQAEFDSNPRVANAKVGDLKFRDANGNGRIEFDADRVVVGSYFPDYTFGFSGSVNYAGFDLGFSLQGAQGFEILNLFRRYIYNMEGNMNLQRGALNRWKSVSEPGDDIHHRANRLATGGNGTTSTWHLESGDYIRMRNITLGYTLPLGLIQKVKLNKARVYFAVQNPFTITDYTGYNPEVNAYQDDALRPGEDYATYPLARTLTAGLNLSF